MAFVLFESGDHRCVAFNDLVRGDDGVQANQFLIQDGRHSAVIDPGGALVYNPLMLALAGSGLNGQHFAFVGYLPQDAAARTQRIRELEANALKTGQTQIAIETPYRNAALLKALVQTLHTHTRLAVACNVTLPAAAQHSALVSDWRRTAPSLPLDGPAVFLFGR